MVTYNRCLLLDQILSKIQGFSCQYSQLVVVNNASTDETSEVLTYYEESLRLQVITTSENIGHGAALAIGLKLLHESDDQPEFVVFLEDDSIPKHSYFDFLISAIQGSPFSLISSGGYQVRLGRRIKIQPRLGEVLQSDFGLFDGAIAKFDDLMKVGFPVKDWFMMFDDFEYCYRIKKYGFKIGVMENPHIQILHEGWGGGSSHSHMWRSYFQSRNYVHFIRLHFTWWNLLDFLVLQSKRVIGGCFAINGWKTTKMRLRGIRAGILGKKGKSLDLITLKEV